MVPGKEIVQDLITESKLGVDIKCSTKNVTQDFKLLTDEQGRNKKKVLCRRCKGEVFAALHAKLINGKEPKMLKEMSVGGKLGQQCEKTDVWWFTSNEYDFETIGFMTLDGGLNALMCGDCEFGPIGWRTRDNKNFWVAAERMDYA
ncbi:unnamed protein product [Thelazia callipaeda]|uniref:Guanine nucleotide exchange factor MSS4 homolog n=1 Tax=Thelazia callipaeda TaxID=103827 RepID=A0A0N5CJ61_THECL|nr:unnamed protein product [Thelazia callipaeda]